MNHESTTDAPENGLAYCFQWQASPAENKSSHWTQFQVFKGDNWDDAVSNGLRRSKDSERMEAEWPPDRIFTHPEKTNILRLSVPGERIS